MSSTHSSPLFELLVHSYHVKILFYTEKMLNITQNWFFLKSPLKFYQYSICEFNNLPWLNQNSPPLYIFKLLKRWINTSGVIIKDVSPAKATLPTSDSTQQVPHCRRATWKPIFPAGKGQKKFWSGIQDFIFTTTGSPSGQLVESPGAKWEMNTACSFYSFDWRDLQWQLQS